MKKTVEFRLIRSDGDANYWYVEAYSPEGSMFPVGTSYVMEYEGHVQLNFMFVADQWRNQGYARLMMSAIRERWPNFVRTGRMRD